MKDNIEQNVAGEDVFDLGNRRSLADVLAACEAELTGTALRDTRSAFRVLTERAGADLAAILARPQDIRPLLADLSAGQLAVSEKRLANIRSCVRKAVERFGMRRTWITREITPSPAWQALFARIERREYRWALSRFACYCTVKGIAPEDVSSESLVGFQAALEAEMTIKDPVNNRKHVIAIWNMCRKCVPGWPDTRLSSPFKMEPYMYPLAAFPEPFQVDVAAWIERQSTADPLDLTAPIRALRPATLDRHVLDFRRLASALVHQGAVTMDQMTGFQVFFEDDHLRTALVPFADKSVDYVLKKAALLRLVARQRNDIPEGALATLDGIIRRINQKAAETRGRMGARNRERLKQFDDEAVVRRLLAFPGQERDRALKLRNPARQAKGIERALAIAILSTCGLRIRNLRMLRLDRNIRRTGERVFLEFGMDETKTHAELSLELPREVIDLLDLFLAEYRPLLPNADGPWLFPGGKPGTPRTYSAMRVAVSWPLRRHAGIELSPHLYRHIIAKIVIERAPECAVFVARMFGHKSRRVLFQAYLGTEGPAAARRVAELLAQVARGQDPEGRS